MRVVGSVAFGGGSVRIVSLDIPLDPEKTLEFFRDALAQNGCTFIVSSSNITVIESSCNLSKTLPAP